MEILKNNDDDIESIRELWWQGRKISVICRTLGRDRSTVRWYIRKYEMQRDPNLPVEIVETHHSSRQQVKQYRDYYVHEEMKLFYKKPTERRCGLCQLVYPVSQFAKDKVLCNDCAVEVERMRNG